MTPAMQRGAPRLAFNRFPRPRALHLVQAAPAGKVVFLGGRIASVQVRLENEAGRWRTGQPLASSVDAPGAAHIDPAAGVAVREGTNKGYGLTGPLRE